MLSRDEKRTRWRDCEIVRFEEQLIIATTQMDAATVALDRFGHSSESYQAISNLCGVPATTLRHRKNGRMSIQQRATTQQYLNPQEEKALVTYVLRMSQNGYPLPVKFLRDLALVIARQRGSIFQIPETDHDDIRPPRKNWPQAFYKRHPDLKAIRMQAMDWLRHDHHIHEKVVEWFLIIGKELANLAILAENTYNMDETGVTLSILNSLKVLVHKNELKNYRGAGVKRTMITAIECISADGRYLHLLIIWPAATHRSTGQLTLPQDGILATLIVAIPIQQ